jgi:hypothetical protein
MTPAIDFNRPDAAQGVGGDLVATNEALVHRLGPSTTIATVADLERAVVARQQIGEAIKRVEAFFEPVKRMAFQLHKALCAREQAILAPLRALDKDTSRAMSAFKDAEDRARREREEALAEAQRREREGRAIVEAGHLERAGEHGMAAAVVAEAIAAPPPVVVLPDVVKGVADVRFRRLWKWRYVGGDKARALTLLPRDYLAPDEARIGAHATHMKESAKIPGIEFYFEDVPVR